ncbi:MAG: ribose-phosphate pyrophosphokinase, partial [Thaumarchaeota archaeon]
SLVSYVKKNFKLNQPVVVAPDFGGSKRSEAFASLLQAMFVQLSKKRDRVTGQVKVESSKLEVKGRDVLVVDDIISTGGTVRAAGIVLREAGAARVIAVCSHPLLVGDAMEKLESAGIREVVGTNTVPSEVSKVDVSEAIAEHLKTVTE